MAEWILMTRAQIDGAVREAGYVFDRPEDWEAGGTTVRGDGPVGSATEFKLDPLAVKRSDLPKPAPSDSAAEEAPAAAEPEAELALAPTPAEPLLPSALPDPGAPPPANPPEPPKAP